MLKLLQDLKSEKIISELNYQFAKLIDQKQQHIAYTETQKNLAVLLSALVSYQVMQGDSCIHLEKLSLHNLFNLSGKNLKRDFIADILQKIGHISPLAWQQTLDNHIAFSQMPSNVAPLLFQQNRLYFYRYWQAENRIARYLQQAVSIEQQNANTIELNKTILSSLFTPQAKIDWQQVAVATALAKRFCLISGGPGTGKTRTVAMLLATLQLKQLKQSRLPLNIALAAPTGKAAARLKESISASLAELDLPETVKQTVPTKSSTIHSLIGIMPHSDTPRYHQTNPLHLDLLVVDEASMIDLFVMDKLLNALKPSTRLILLGDKDQLASVEAGNMMGELGELIHFGYSPQHSAYLTETTGYPIQSANTQVPAICDSLCHLRHSYRFGENSGIGRLAAEINAQQAVRSWQTFANPQFDDLHLYGYPSVTEFSEKRDWIQYCVDMVVHKAVELYRDYLALVKQRQASPQQIPVSAVFAAFQKVRFLSALRVSELGVERLNQTIAEALLQARLIHFKHSRDSYIGKPILITENAPQNHIFSGDIGIMLPDEQGQLRIYFDNQMNGEYLSISPSRVPSYEPAYVMTVHKSQGSEFTHTLMIMPLTPSPVLTKELLYTAVTRAKSTFSLFGDAKTWKQAVSICVQRQSGLREQLQQFE
ncbi:exodeoxyribonuclease V subunit alpha [Glaesserella sp.]|uniref:exodeoxyribonuclease V subunit alpha n=1 Tax=Glaesserella sp. TaxID=2094731 RepID=UPI0035A048A6